MTQEEFQRLVLEKLVSLESGQIRMETRMGNIEARVGNMETRMGNMETRMGNIETNMENIESRMGNIETRQIQQETHLQEIKKFQQTSILETIEYIHDHLVTKDDLHASMKTLNDRLFVQEVELNKLKLVR